MPNSLNDSNETRPLPSSTQGSDKICLRLEGLGHVPSFKNQKRTRVDRETMKPVNFTEPSVKHRMKAIEDAIVCALFSLCQTTESETRMECRKRLQTLLSGLLDDSIREIPKGEFDVEYVDKGKEGVAIEIELIPEPL